MAEKRIILISNKANQDTFDRLFEIKNQSGLSMNYIATNLLKEVLKSTNIEFGGLKITSKKDK